LAGELWIYAKVGGELVLHPVLVFDDVTTRAAIAGKV